MSFLLSTLKSAIPYSILESSRSIVILITNDLLLFNGLNSAMILANQMMGFYSIIYCFPLSLASYYGSLSVQVYLYNSLSLVKTVYCLSIFLCFFTCVIAGIVLIIFPNGFQYLFPNSEFIGSDLIYIYEACMMLYIFLFSVSIINALTLTLFNYKRNLIIYSTAMVSLNILLNVLFIEVFKDNINLMLISLVLSYSLSNLLFIFLSYYFHIRKYFSSESILLDQIVKWSSNMIKYGSLLIFMMLSENSSFLIYLSNISKTDGKQMYLLLVSYTGFFMHLQYGYSKASCIYVSMYRETRDYKNLIKSIISIYFVNMILSLMVILYIEFYRYSIIDLSNALYNTKWLFLGCYIYMIGCGIYISGVILCSALKVNVWLVALSSIIVYIFGIYYSFVGFQLYDFQYIIFLAPCISMLSLGFITFIFVYAKVRYLINAYDIKD